MSQYPAAAAEPTDAPTWSAAQMARLDSEWRRLQRAFAYHPFVEVVPVSGDPPAEYHVHYKVTTLVIDGAGQLVYVAECPVHLWLPTHFPHTAPVVRPMAALFHPNATGEWIHLNPAWRPDAGLVDVVTQVGFYLAFRSYDPNAVANPVAMNWVYANPHLLPTDAAANFTPSAAGEPLVRITRSGLATLRALQERLESACERLVTAAPPPSRDELDPLLREVRLTLPLFTESDVPEHLRTTAAELQELAGSLAESDNVWTRIARQIGTSDSVSNAAGEVIKAEESLRRVLAAEAAPPARQSGSSRKVPPAAVVQPAAMALRKAVREAENAVDRLRTWLTRLAAEPRLPAAPAQPGTVLERTLGREMARLAVASEPARAAGAWLASLEPVLQRAAIESAAADRLAAWAEHEDLLRRGHELVTRIKAVAPADLQSYRVETASGKSGPFEFEQRVDPGSGGPAIAVWNARASIVRVLDVETEEVIARGEGRVRLSAAAQGSGTATATTIHVGEHTDELRVQLEYLVTHSRDALARLRQEEPEPPMVDGRTTWAARLAADFDQPLEQQSAQDLHRRAVEGWKQMLVELAALGRFKQRLATYHLLTRLIDFARRFRAERERLAAAVGRADSRLAEIGARSGRDTETDGLIIPEQYAAEYAQHLSERDRARQQARRLEASLDAGAERLKVRLSKPRLYGSAELPHFRLLPPPPEAYVQQQPHLSDDAVEQLVTRLEELLGTSLRQPVGAQPQPATEAAGGAT